MEGCENGCSFCVVPHTRGRERSRLSREIVEEVTGLAARGCREVTLLGQNVNSYGRTSTEGVDFAGLLHQLDTIEGLARIRFTTSHPMAVTDRMIRAMAELPTVCEHLHLPLQSGSDRVLERMRRDYTITDYEARVRALRGAVAGLALTTDIIVAFPGETDDDFEQTLEAVRAIGFAGLFAFKYSPRPNTTALALDGRVDDRTASARLQRLIALHPALVAARHAALIGTTHEWLAEDRSRSGPGWLVGRLRANDLVHVEAAPHLHDDLIGRLAPVTIVRARAGRLEGELR
jgi:tRNA-2-methylthio-N6-dimethylallyladenosine synthase